MGSAIFTSEFWNWFGWMGEIYLPLWSYEHKSMKATAIRCLGQAQCGKEIKLRHLACAVRLGGGNALWVGFQAEARASRRGFSVQALKHVGQHYEQP